MIGKQEDKSRETVISKIRIQKRLFDQQNQNPNIIFGLFQTQETSAKTTSGHCSRGHRQGDATGALILMLNAPPLPTEGACTELVGRLFHLFIVCGIKER